MLGYASLFGSLYPLTQIYQYHDDQSRGDNTFTITLGFARSIRFSFITMLCSFTIFAIVSLLENANFYIFILPLFLWIIILIPWMISGGNYPQKRGMYRALWAWAVTDVTVVAVFSVLWWRFYKFTLSKYFVVEKWCVDKGFEYGNRWHLNSYTLEFGYMYCRYYLIFLIIENAMKWIWVSDWLYETDSYSQFPDLNAILIIHKGYKTFIKFTENLTRHIICVN